MDEPLSALDLKLKREITPWLESLNRELDIPVLYVSHEPGEVARLADHIVLLDKGREVAYSPINDIFTRLDLPLALGDRAAAIVLVHATVAGHDRKFGLTDLAFAGGRFSMSYKPIKEGQSVRLRIFARDVSVTLEKQCGTSILNILASRVSEILPIGESQVMIKLLAGDTPLLARITKKSAQALDLKPGKTVYAQVKSVALLS